MAAIIEYNILQSGFEQVLLRIGEIIFVEWTSQKLKQPGRYSEEISLYRERVTPMDSGEQLYINISFSSSTNNQQNQKDGSFKTIYFIDFYVNGEASVDKTGSQDSSDRLLKYMGLIRYILAFTGYNVLLFDDGLIGGTSVEEISSMDTAFPEDSNFTRFGRISFGVRILENQALWQAQSLSETSTSVKLGQSDKGYKFVFENN